MAINKNFVVKNGLEVASNLIYADAVNSRVGFGTTTVGYTVQVVGGIGATDVKVSGFTTTTTLTVTNTSHLSTVNANGIGATNLNVSGVGTFAKSITTGVSTAGNLSVGTAGTTITTLNGGKVGIGTTNALHRFQVGSANTTGFTTTTSGLFVVTHAGRVGIQTGQPTSELHVFGNQTVTGVITATTFNGQVNSGVGTITRILATHLDSTNANIGVATVGFLTGTNLYYTGISTLANVVIGSGTTDLIVTGDARVTGILTIGTSSITLNGNTDIVTVGTGVTISGSGDITAGIITASTIYGSVEGSLVSDTINSENGFINVGIVTYVTGTNLNYSGIGSIGTLDSDVGTIDYLSGINLNYSGISTLTTLNSTNFTSSSISGTAGTITTLGSTNFTSSSISGTAGTITTFNSTVGTITNSSGTNLNYSGIGTISNIKIQNGEIQAVSGIATYRGDGSKLAGVTYGVGIRSDGLEIAGAGITVLNFSGTGISTVTANVGIATIFIEGGGAVIPTSIVLIDETSTATTQYLTFADGSGTKSLRVDTSLLSYVPSTNTIHANLTGTATTATRSTATDTVAVTDTTTSASTHYLAFVSAASGDRTVRVDSTGLTYIPDTNVIGASISGNSATVTTNANLTGDVTSVGNATAIASGVIVNDDISASAAIAVSKLAASTISGVTLGNNLATLTRGTYLTGSDYNGSGASTFAVDATSSNTGSKVVARDANGDFSARIITCTDLNSTSDINLKDNIRPFEDALTTTEQLNGVHFNWKNDDRKSIGVIAQEIEKILPELVVETDGTKTVNYNGLIGVLIEAVKELSEKVKVLESKS